MRLSDKLAGPFDAGMMKSPDRHRRKWYKRAKLAVAGTVVAAMATTAGPAMALAAPAGKAQMATSNSIDVAVVAAATYPAVVDVDTAVDALEGGGTGAGTGMIISPSGLIVTNNHVVLGADKVTVVVPRHGTHVATVICTDPSADIAVLKVSGLRGLPMVNFGDSSTLTVGAPVVAIGNALGLGGSPTVTQGIISATRRTITATDESGSNPETLHGLLQTDAPIAPGNSGGPLVDAAAKVIGMDTAAASAGTAGASLGFAIPANTVRTVVGEIEAHKDLPGLVCGRRAFLGVEVVNSSRAGRVNFGFGPGFTPIASTPSGTPGVVVAAVDPGSPAASAGLESGDVITAVDGHATTTTTALSKVIQAKKPGQAVRLKLSTQAGTKTVEAHLSEGPID